MNRRSHELLHAVYATPPSALSTDAVNFKLYNVHAHYNELDAIYAFNFQPRPMGRGPMKEWHKPHEAIHVTVGSIPEST